MIKRSWAAGVNGLGNAVLHTHTLHSIEINCLKCAEILESRPKTRDVSQNDSFTFSNHSLSSLDPNIKALFNEFHRLQTDINTMLMEELQEQKYSGGSSIENSIFTGRFLLNHTALSLRLDKWSMQIENIVVRCFFKNSKFSEIKVFGDGNCFITGSNFATGIGLHESTSPTPISINEIITCIRQEDAPLGSNRFPTSVPSIYSLNQRLVTMGGKMRDDVLNWAEDKGYKDSYEAAMSNLEDDGQWTEGNGRFNRYDDWVQSMKQSGERI